MDFTHEDSTRALAPTGEQARPLPQAPLDIDGLPGEHLAVLAECVAEAWRNHEQNDAASEDDVAADIVRYLNDRYDLDL